MGYEMAARLAQGGGDVTVWDRTRAKAEPLTRKGAKIATSLADLAACDIVFCMVSTWDDVRQVVAGPTGLLSGKPESDQGGAAFVRLFRAEGSLRRGVSVPQDDRSRGKLRRRGRAR